MARLIDGKAIGAEKAHALCGRLVAVPGVSLVDPEAEFFREFALRLPDGVSPASLVSRMARGGILAGIPLASVPGGGAGLLVAVTEKRTPADIDRLAEVLAA